MFKTEDLYIQNTMPEWSDINLELYKDFTCKCLFPKIFRYYIENDNVIDIQFKEWAMKHLWGIQHIDFSIDKYALFDVIDNGLSIDTFMKDPKLKKRLMDQKDRIRMFTCIYHILKTGKMFYVSKGKLEGSDVKVDYIKSHIISTKGVNIGMRYEEGVYVPLTILIGRAINPTKTISSLQPIKVKRLEIIENDKVIECIDCEQYGRI